MIFKLTDGGVKREIDVVDWTTRLKLRDIALLCRHCRGDGPLKRAALTEGEVRKALNFSRRAHALAQAAADLDVRLMIDAEQTYFQPAIDAVVACSTKKLRFFFFSHSSQRKSALSLPLGSSPASLRRSLQRRHNAEQPVIFTTVQCYLTDALPRLRLDLARCERGGYAYGVKLVRGAYMFAERERAERLGEPSPIHATQEETHACYDAAVELVVRTAASKLSTGLPRVEAMLATHNAASVAKGVTVLTEHGLAETNAVAFAQLLGMADHLTYGLADQGLPVCKYVPFGPLHETLPYLVRRAQENSAFVHSEAVHHELILLRRELTRRVFGR